MHADVMYVCILDATGEVVEHRNIPTRPVLLGQSLFKERKTSIIRSRDFFVLDERGPDRCWAASSP